MQYKKDLHNYRQGGHNIYKMIPYIQDAIDDTLMLKLYGFFDANYGIPLKTLLDLAKNSQSDKDCEFSKLEAELELFEKTNDKIITSIIRLRGYRAHVNPKNNPKNNPPSIATDDVEAVVEWIKDFINKLHKLCGKSAGGYLYDERNIFMDVLDVLKEKNK